MMMSFPQGNLQFSPFGELRSYERTPLVELKSIYGLSNLRDVQTVAGSATITNTNGEFKLTTTANGTDAATLDSAERGRYLAGQGSEMGIGIRISDTPTGSQAVRWGYFDDNDGYGFGVDATGFFVFDRTGGSETLVRPANFTADKLDGTGASGQTLNLATGYIFQIEFSWYGYGVIEYKVVMYNTTTFKQETITFHRLRKTQQVSVQDPNLPVRAKVENGGTANAFDSVYVGGRQFSTLGRYNPNRRITSQYRLALANVSTTFKPTVTFRRKSAFDSVSVKTQGFTLLSDQDLVVQLRLNGTLTGASYATPTDHTASETALEADVAASDITNGEVLWTDLVDASGSGVNASGGGGAIVIPEDFIGVQPVTLCVRRAGGTDATVSAVLRAAEEW